MILERTCDGLAQVYSLIPSHPTTMDTNGIALAYSLPKQVLLMLSVNRDTLAVIVELKSMQASLPETCLMTAASKNELANPNRDRK
jgi:hypothetical protein